MISHVSHVMTLANSIIGVSVLAMPFCFKQCGIILAIVILLLCSLLSRLACHFLIKSAVMSRRRNFEYLAFHAFGPMGKFLVELFIIGFLLGTCIAFFVVIGDLGPQIIGKMLNKNPEDLRLSFLLAAGGFIVLPLGLLRNIDSLSTVCTATIGFYLCLVLKVFGESMEHIFRADWHENVNYWRSAGILQCLPIFSMALFCQTQLFEIYECIPNVSLEKMNFVVRGALNICTLVYLCVGFFGYVAFCNQSFSGNILTSFEPSLGSDVIKIGFVLSVIFSFPLVIFPCRASLNSLLFHQGQSHEPSSKYIPEIRFRCLTFTIVSVAMITGMLTPNIEFVLGLVGSTIGVMICVIFPVAFFIAISTKNTNERLLAQALLFIGVWIMILGTYANLYAMEDSSTTKVIVHTERPMLQMNNLQLNHIDEKRQLITIPVPNILIEDKDILKLNKKKDPEKNPNIVEVRREPPVPVERLTITEKIPIEIKKPNDPMIPSFRPEIEKIVEEIKILDKSMKLADKIAEKTKDEEIEIPNAEDKIKALEENVVNEYQPDRNSIIAGDKKTEDIIPHEGGSDEVAESLHEERIRKTLEQHKIETKKLIEEQKEILQDLKEQKKALEMEKIEKNVIPQASEIVVQKSEKLEVVPVDLNQLNDKIHKNSILKKATVVKIPQISDKNNLSVINSSFAESRGPILNALTNHTVMSKVANAEKLENIQLASNEMTDNKNPPDLNVKKEEKNSKTKIQYPLPLALKFINETKQKESQKQEEDKSIDEPSVIQRDILETHGREKRDVDDTKIDNNIKNIVKADNNTFQRSEKNEETTTTTDIIIKTNAYLEEQQFHDILAFDSKSPLLNLEYQILKKRDLKALKPGKRRD